MGITRSIAVIAMIYIAGQKVANTGGRTGMGQRKRG